MWKQLSSATRVKRLQLKNSVLNSLLSNLLNPSNLWVPIVGIDLHCPKMAWIAQKSCHIQRNYQIAVGHGQINFQCMMNYTYIHTLPHTTMGQGQSYDSSPHDHMYCAKWSVVWRDIALKFSMVPDKNYLRKVTSFISFLQLSGKSQFTLSGKPCFSVLCLCLLKRSWLHTTLQFTDAQTYTVLVQRVDCLSL